jgi:uncharacterized lipoprotein NlpE involved in copper resistance
MTLKILSLLTLVILLTGCDENTIIECKQMGFKGFTFVSENSTPSLYCSNGTYITTKDGKEAITSDGLKQINSMVGKYHNVPNNLVYIDFEHGIQDFKEAK